jgi:hypothetical protein
MKCLAAVAFGQNRRRGENITPGRAGMGDQDTKAIAKIPLQSLKLSNKFIDLLGFISVRLIAAMTIA